MISISHNTYLMISDLVYTIVVNDEDMSLCTYCQDSSISTLTLIRPSHWDIRTVLPLCQQGGEGCKLIQHAVNLVHEQTISLKHLSTYLKV